MRVEIIVHDRIGNFMPGDIVEIEDGVFLRALLKGGKADVINPPDWTLENASNYQQVKDANPVRASDGQKSRSKSRKNSGTTPGDSTSGHGGSSGVSAS